MKDPKLAFLCIGIQNETNKDIFVEFWPAFGEIYQYLQKDPNGEEIVVTDSTSVSVLFLESLAGLTKEKVDGTMKMSFPFQNQYTFVHEEGDLVASFVEIEGSDVLSGLYYEDAELEECVIVKDAK